MLTSLSRASQVKLIDFGSAVIFDPRQPAPLYNRKSSPPPPPCRLITHTFSPSQASTERPPSPPPKSFEENLTTLPLPKSGPSEFSYPFSSLESVLSSMLKLLKLEESLDPRFDSVTRWSTSFTLVWRLIRLGGSTLKASRTTLGFVLRLLRGVDRLHHHQHRPTSATTGLRCS